MHAQGTSSSSAGGSTQGGATPDGDNSANAMGALPTVDETQAGIPPRVTSERKPVACLILGMAGAGKSSLLARLNAYLHEKKEKYYMINLDPALPEQSALAHFHGPPPPAAVVLIYPPSKTQSLAGRPQVLETSFGANIDIRDTVNYKEAPCAWYSTAFPGNDLSNQLGFLLCTSCSRSAAKPSLAHRPRTSCPIHPLRLYSLSRKQVASSLMSASHASPLLPARRFERVERRNGRARRVERR
eukprot:6193838-Pleurochrysis_carterae.AAC.5